MEVQEEGAIEVDLPPDIQLEINSSFSNDSLASMPSVQVSECTKNPVSHQSNGDAFSASSSSLDSLNMILEKQRVRQLNHPHHQDFINVPQGLGTQLSSVKETSEIFLKYDPISKRKVLNTYEIINELGHGQHGKVKLARDLLTKQLVAIKIVDRHEKKVQKFFRIKKSNSLTQNDKIKREIAIMKKCHYKHVVRLIEVLDDLKSRKIYLVLEYCSRGEVKWCPGDQLETEARGPPLLSFQRTREIIRGVVLGLEYLHYQGVIHRDIKPANLLISEDGTVKISDFGVSLAASGANNSDMNAESIDELELAKTAGTPAFFAPEICLGNEAFEKFNMSREDLFKGSSISFMIDIWALGVTLYCLLFGMLPFISDYELELFEKIVNDPVEFPDYDKVKMNRVSWVSCVEEYEMAKDLVSKLLEKNPMKRIAIPELKKHAFVCWDFYHVQSADGNYLNSKLDELKEFQLEKEDQFKQISISKRELKNAVLGVGKKIKESVFKALPRNQNHNKIAEAVETKIEDRDKQAPSDKSSQSSYIVSEGSVMSNLSKLQLDIDDNEMKNQNISSFDNEINTAVPFKKGYSMCNDNDDNENSNEIKKEASQKEIFEKELQKFDEKHDPKSIVDLPINSSFASLDSFYIDNYAMSKVGSNLEHDNTIDKRESKATPSIFARPPPVSGTYQPFSINRNASTSDNFLRRSSSRLDFLNHGIQSTRNDRIPQSHSRLMLQRPNNSVSPQQGSTRPSCLSKAPDHYHTESPFSKHNLKNVIKAETGNSGDQNRPDEFKERNYSIKRGNFFHSFNGQDEDTSHSSDMGTDDSSYSSCSDSESEESAAESLPFEFAVDSANASVLSMRDVSGLDQVRHYMQPQPSRQSSRRGSLTPSRSVGVDLYNNSSDDSNDSDELVLTVGKGRHQRHQGSSQTSGSSACSSRRNTLASLGISLEDSPQTDRMLTATPGSVATLTANRFYNESQNGPKLPEEYSSPNINQKYVPSISVSPSNSERTLIFPSISTKATTHVNEVSSSVRYPGQLCDDSRDLLKSVLKSTSGNSSRRQSLPYLREAETIEKKMHRDKAQAGKNEHRPSGGNIKRREPRASLRRIHEAGEERSKSISIAQLHKHQT